MVRRRGEPISDSIEIKSEHYQTIDEVLEVSDRFIIETIEQLEESVDE